MSDQEILKIYNEMVYHYKDELPSLEHEPKRFAYYVKLFLYQRSKTDGRTIQDQAL